MCVCVGGGGGRGLGLKKKLKEGSEEERDWEKRGEWEMIKQTKRTQTGIESQ